MNTEQTIKVPKKRKKIPQTLNDRLNKIYKNEGITDHLERHERKELGIILVTKFFSEDNKVKYKKHVGKKKIVENGEEMEVLNYPSHFVPVMDAIIFEYLKTKRIC